MSVPSDRSSTLRTPLSTLQPRSQEKPMPLPTTTNHKPALPISDPPRQMMPQQVPSHPKSEHEGSHIPSDHGIILHPPTGHPTSMYPSTVQKPGYKAPSQLRQPTKGSKGSIMFLTSDDHVLSKHIEDTHFPDESHFLEVRPLFEVVEDIICHAIQAVEGTDQLSPHHRRKERETQRGDDFTLNKYYLKCMIERVFCEMSPFTVKHWSGADGHETTLSVLKTLSVFSWEAKAVITLAAFALNYGELWLISEVYLMNPLAKSMAALMQVPEVMEHAGFYRKQFDAINSLSKAMLNMLTSIIEFRELPPDYVNKEAQGYKDCETLVPIAVFWIVRAAVAATAQISSLAGEGTVPGELSNWEFNLKRTYEKFKSALQRLRDGVMKLKEEEEYAIISDIFRTRIELKRICEDPLYDGTAKSLGYLEVLNGKNVSLLVSDGLNIPQDELSILEQIYTDSKVHSYEILWVPIVDPSAQWTDAMQDQFERMKQTMPWYSVSHPSKVYKWFVRYAREHWRFKGEPILVVLDVQRRLLSTNAIHMMWIWGSSAFPFTTSKEIDLWRTETWRLELLVDGIDQIVLDWVRDGKFILVYGTSDDEWIHKFTKAAKEYARAADVNLEMVYVGNMELDRDLLIKHTGAITTDKLGHCWQDTSAVWFFWKRIESMFKSKILLEKYNDHTDFIVQELKKMRSYAKGPSGWVLLSKGSEILYQAPMSIVTEALQNGPREFPVKFVEYCRGKTPHCAEISFTSMAYIPPLMRCPECHRNMEKQTSFKCCHKDGPWTDALENELGAHPPVGQKEPRTWRPDAPGSSSRNELMAHPRLTS